MRNSGYASGEEALPALKEARASGDPFQIAILDYQMPGMDGKELGRRIKADPKLRDTVLLMLTSVGQRGDAKEYSEIGLAAYLTKPVHQSQLMDVLATVCAPHSKGEEAGPGTR